MAVRKMKLEERIEHSLSQTPKEFIPNEEGAEPIKISDDVRKDFQRAKWETAHYLHGMNEKYKEHENETATKEYESNLEGLVGYANDLADKVKHDEYLAMDAHDPNAESRIIHYISLGITAQSGGKIKGDEATAKAREKFHEFTHPEGGKKSSREVLKLLKEGLKYTHTQVHLRRPNGIFASYEGNNDKKKELAALIAALNENESGQMMDMVEYNSLVPSAIEHASSHIGHFATQYMGLDKKHKPEHEYELKEAA